MIVISPQAAVYSAQIWTTQEVGEARDAMRTTSASIVFTNGHFDLLHVGHVDYLETARTVAGAGKPAYLIVGINGDASTRRLKGEGRPLIPAIERARLVASLRCVTAAVIFEEDTATDLIRTLQPDWYVKGGDYTDKRWPEREIAESLGIQVGLIPFTPDHSTTALITRIKALPDRTPPL